jgi:hypothetical protein
MGGKRFNQEHSWIDGRCRENSKFLFGAVFFHPLLQFF